MKPVFALFFSVLVSFAFFVEISEMRADKPRPARARKKAVKVPLLLDQRIVLEEMVEKISKKELPIFSFAWGSDYPDAENNLALFYGPNEAPGKNHFNYKNPEYDKLYEAILDMPPSPERTAIDVEMRDMIVEDCPFAGAPAGLVSKPPSKEPQSDRGFPQLV